MRRLRSNRKKVWRQAGATLVSLVLVLFVFNIIQLTEALQYDRSKIAAGQVWRVLTCHWTHWTPEHLFWDALAWSILFTMCLLTDKKQTILVLILVSCAVPLSIWLFQPEIIFYRGLSGLDTALFQLYLLQRWIVCRREKDYVGLTILSVVFIGLILKILFECVTHSHVFVSTLGAGVIGLPLAHIVGTAISSLSYLYQLRFFSFSK
jgi:rhomboid family GlyGly-CTERM serine protease